MNGPFVSFYCLMIGPLLLKQRLEQAFLNMECLSHLSARRDGIARAHSFLTLRCWLFDYLIVWFFSPPWLLSFFWRWTSAWGDRLRKSRLWAGRNAGFFSVIWSQHPRRFFFSFPLLLVCVWKPFGHFFAALSRHVYILWTSIARLVGSGWLRCSRSAHLLVQAFCFTSRKAGSWSSIFYRWNACNSFLQEM